LTTTQQFVPIHKGIAENMAYYIILLGEVG